MNTNKKTQFLSLRWRFITPLFVVVMIVAVAGAYFLARNLTGGLRPSQENLLLQTSRSIAERTAQLYDYQRQEAQRVAFTSGIPEALRDNQPVLLEPLLKSLLQINELDTLIVTDTTGREVLGIQRTTTGSETQFALSTETNLGNEPLIRAVLDDAFNGATGFLRTPGGLMLFTAVPVNIDGLPIGVVAVGQTLDAVLHDLRASASANLVMYGPDGDLLQTTFPDSVNRQPLTLGDTVFSQALLATQQIPVQPLTLDEQTYQGAYQPFNFGPQTLGVIGAIMRDDIPYVTETGRQLTALSAATLAAAAVVVAFIGISRISSRAARVAEVASELAAGQATARTRMQPTDEVSAVGHALDRYADNAQAQQDALQKVLRRQRREFNHIMAVFESMPQGVIVQGLDGRVLIMNDRARYLLGSQRVFRSAGLHELSEVVQEQLGPALAPGLYALGDPHRINLDERVLSAQAAAVMSMSSYRLGTVVLLRDITDEVQQEYQRDLMLERLAHDIQQPLVNLGRLANQDHSEMIKVFARQITRQAVALQRMIVDMREMDSVDTLSVQRRQRPLAVETLVWAVANEWRQVAKASGLTMHIMIEQTGLYILGDEKRLRWAIGNVIDNAIKYTLPGGALTLEIQEEEDGKAYLRVRDSGVGIARDERQYVFTRFYRGQPTAPDGTVIRVPGMGQGLHIARRIIESHGGTIQLKSSQGVGTAVYIALPLTAPVTIKLPHLEGDMDGETIQLPENMMVNLERQNRDDL